MSTKKTKREESLDKLVEETEKLGLYDEQIDAVTIEKGFTRDELNKLADCYSKRGQDPMLINKCNKALGRI